MTSATNRKSSRRLEKEVDNSLHKLDQDIDLLRANLSPGKIIDDLAFDRFSGNLNELAKHLRLHPIGSSFLALGTFMLSQQQSEAEEFGHLKQMVRNKFSSKASGESLATGENFDQDSIDGNAFGFGDSEEHNSEGLLGEDSFSEVDGAIPLESKRHQIKEQVNQLLDDHSLAFMALGLGLGVASGRALPSGAREQQLFQDYLSPRLSNFSHDLEQALDQSFSSFKEQVIKKLSA